MKKYKPVIGLEVHIELNTVSKMFCKCSAEHFGVRPNTNTCPVCLGLPGALPYANSKAIKSTLKLGLAFGCKVNKHSKFDRKHYFYPDLPKAFQISQYDIPFCVNGQWTMDNGQKIGITRIHLEEDTAKLIHTKVKGRNATLIDFNRSGVPLLELVTEPDFDSVDEVIGFLKEVQAIVRYLNISSADMEKGTMRLEANISLAKVKGRKLPDYKVELKNINSFRYLKKALLTEIKRQSKVLVQGGALTQETRGFDERKSVTFTQRGKEEAQDYRYFPEPDLPPLSFSNNEINNLKNSIPEMPGEKRERFKRTYMLPLNYIEVLTGEIELANLFEGAVKLSKKHKLSPKMVADVIVNRKLPFKTGEPANLVRKIVNLTKRAYTDDKKVDRTIQKVLASEKKAVADFKAGKKQVLGYLIGKSQEYLKGKGDPAKIREKLLEEL